MWPMVRVNRSPAQQYQVQKQLGFACLRAKAVNLTGSCRRMESQLAGVPGTTEGYASEVVPQTDVPRIAGVDDRSPRPKS